MGCGGSSQAQPETIVVELSEADRNAIAVQGLKDALKWALEESVKLAKVMDTWKEDGIKIQMPCMDKVNALKEKVGGIPVVGGGAQKAIDEALSPFENLFAEAGVAVCGDARTTSAIAGIVNNLSVDNAVYLCREGGVTACVDYLRDFAKALLKEALTPIVKDIMNGHALTKAWKTLVDAINKAASLAVSWAVQQCFGAIDPKKWKKSKE